MFYKKFVSFNPPTPDILPDIQKETSQPKAAVEDVPPTAEHKPVEVAPQGGQRNTFADIVKNKAKAAEVKQSKPFVAPPMAHQEKVVTEEPTKSVDDNPIKAATVTQDITSEKQIDKVELKSNQENTNQKAISDDKAASVEPEKVVEKKKDGGKKKIKKGVKAEDSELAEVLELVAAIENKGSSKKNKKGPKTSEATTEDKEVDNKKEGGKKTNKKGGTDETRSESTKQPQENQPAKENKVESKNKSMKNENKKLEQGNNNEKLVEQKQNSKKKNTNSESTKVDSNEKKKEVPKSSNKKEGGKNKPLMKETVASVGKFLKYNSFIIFNDVTFEGGAASGVVEKEAMKELFVFRQSSRRS